MMMDTYFAVASSVQAHFKRLSFAGLFLVAPFLAAQEEQVDAGLNMNELMLWVLDPASAVIWNSIGSIYTEEGEVSRVPQDQEGWDEVRNSAAMVVEVGTSLMMPGRVPDDGPWKAFSIQLREAGLKSIAAAEAKNEERLFMAGNDLYDSCAACHAVYLPVPEYQDFQ